MPALAIRSDWSPEELRALAKGERDARVARRMLAIANALSGMSRETAAQSAGMDRQTLRDWVVRYNADGIAGLADRWGDGRPPRLDVDEQAELAQVILAGPDPEVDGISAYTLEDLALLSAQRFGNCCILRGSVREVRTTQLQYHGRSEPWIEAGVCRDAGKHRWGPSARAGVAARAARPQKVT